MFDLLISSVKRPSVIRFERSDGHQRVLIHGVAMIEIPHHQAFDVAPFRERVEPERPIPASPADPAEACGRTSRRFQSSHFACGAKPCKRSIVRGASRRPWRPTNSNRSDLRRLRVAQQHPFACETVNSLVERRDRHSWKRPRSVPAFSVDVSMAWLTAWSITRA